MTWENGGSMSQGAMIPTHMHELATILLSEAPRLLHVLRTEPKAGLEALEKAISEFQYQAERDIVDSSPEAGECQQFIDESLVSLFLKLGSEADQNGSYVTRAAGTGPVRFSRPEDGGHWVLDTLRRGRD